MPSSKINGNSQQGPKPPSRVSKVNSSQQDLIISSFLHQAHTRHLETHQYTEHKARNPKEKPKGEKPEGEATRPEPESQSYKARAKEPEPQAETAWPIDNKLLHQQEQLGPLTASCCTGEESKREVKTRNLMEKPKNKEAKGEVK